MTSKWISTLAITTVVSLIAAGNAVADEQSPTMVVKAWDLDLADNGDVRALYDRVYAAATTLCRRESLRHYRTTRLQAPLGWEKRCVDESVDAAIRNVGNPQLAALHR